MGLQVLDRVMFWWVWSRCNENFLITPVVAYVKSISKAYVLVKVSIRYVCTRTVVGPVFLLILCFSKKGSVFCFCSHKLKLKLKRAFGTSRSTWVLVSARRPLSNNRYFFLRLLFSCAYSGQMYGCVGRD